MRILPIDMVLNHIILSASNPPAVIIQNASKSGSRFQNNWLFQCVRVQYQKTGDKSGRDTTNAQYPKFSLIVNKNVFSFFKRIKINRKLTDGVDSSVNKRQHTNQIAAKIPIYTGYKYWDVPLSRRANEIPPIEIIWWIKYWVASG